ncbi:MAG: hypothetical protein PHG05_03115 [Candidatus Nanoarchaeia archaeon]|nr:hypothetical protein [Candidatus Nanoarchaeia archaeon]
MKLKKPITFVGIGVSFIKPPLLAEDIIKKADEIFLENLTPKIEQPIEQEESKLEISLKTDILTKYVGRGIIFADNPVIQQTAGLSYDNLSVILFGSLGKERGSTELDGTIEYSLSKSPNLFAGYTFYKLINQNLEKTQEVYVGIGIDTSLNPNLVLIHDFDGGKGDYIKLSLNEAFKVKDINLSAGLAVGYNNHYFRKDSGLGNIDFNISASVPISKAITLTPTLNYSHSFTDDFKSGGFYGGMSLAYESE